jgi:hypothetical protein
MNIKTDSRNYRIHGDKNKALINKSLTECGAGRSILIDKDDVIIAGNGVYEQAQALGLKVRVIESDGSDGFTPNTYNLNHYLHDRESFVPTPTMSQPGSAACFTAICQDSCSNSALRKLSLKEAIEAATKDRGMISQLLEKR